jgi:hypothetical protein
VFLKTREEEYERKAKQLSGLITKAEKKQYDAALENIPLLRGNLQNHNIETAAMVGLSNSGNDKDIRLAQLKKLCALAESAREACSFPTPILFHGAGARLDGQPVDRPGVPTPPTRNGPPPGNGLPPRHSNGLPPGNGRLPASYPLPASGPPTASSPLLASYPPTASSLPRASYPLAPSYRPSASGPRKPIRQRLQDLFPEGQR